MLKKDFFIYLLIAVIFFLAGYSIGLFAPINKVSNIAAKNNAVSTKANPVKGENTFQAGWDAARKRLIDSGFLPIIDDKIEIKTAVGEVKSITDGKIELKIRTLDPLAESDTELKTAIVTAETKIYKLEPRSLEEYQKDLKVYQDRRPATTTDSNMIGSMSDMPSPFTKKDITIADLEIGNQVNVTTAVNIRDIKEFTALEIQVMAIQTPATVFPSPVASSTNSL